MTAVPSGIGVVFQNVTKKYGKMTAVDGVSEVAPIGGYVRQYQGVLDPQRLQLENTERVIMNRTEQMIPFSLNGLGSNQPIVLPARSITPITRLAPVRADKPANASVSAPGTSMALAK